MAEPEAWPIPAGLSKDGRRAAQVLRAFLLEEGVTDENGGTFYSPRQWAERGELYGRTSLVIITHDGGSHAPYFNLDYEAYDAHERLRARMAQHGFWIEAGTCWYSYVFAD